MKFKIYIWSTSVEVTVLFAAPRLAQRLKCAELKLKLGLPGVGLGV